MSAQQIITGLLAAALAVVLVTNRQAPASQSTVTSANDSEWNVLLHLGGYGPYVQKSYNLSHEQPENLPFCSVDQVHMIARHAERYPTVTAGIHMLELYHKLAAVASPLNGSLEFADHWSFFTGQPSTDFEQLTSTGRYAGTATAFKMGVDARTRYKDLLRSATNSSRPLRLWASDSRRVIDTAKYFSMALLGLDWERLSELEIIPETAEQGANTLTPGDTCLKYAEDHDDYGWSVGVRVVDEFKGTYLRHAQQRLLSENPELDLSEDELYVMQELCGFELMAVGESAWCDVFTTDEWLGFAYARDLLHYYRSGPGNPYAATMGWLWLNATASLLKQGPYAGPLFFSFVHDGDIMPMLAALEVLPQAPLPRTRIDHERVWRVSDTVPMGARIVFERLTCKTEGCWANEMYPNHVYCQPGEDTQHIRILVNDKQVPLPGCDTGPGQTCPLEEFTKRIKERGEEVGIYADVCGLSKDAPTHITFLHQ